MDKIENILDLILFATFLLLLYSYISYTKQLCYKSIEPFTNNIILNTFIFIFIVSAYTQYVINGV